jgi:hypothetical protein
MEWQSNGFVVVPNTPARRYSITPLLLISFRSISVPRRAFCHPERSEGSRERKQRKLDVASFVRSLALARDDRDYFLSFHFNTTPCMTPPISRSFSLSCTMSARVKPVMA